ncbi:MAG: hypothetical protein M1541_11440 [Acidobacteria bacterium]|nr:hypothetical protein [Acidobacteriota bacterium]
MENDNQGHDNHGRMNHGMGMMLLGCLVPIAAILLLRKLGVATGIALAVGVGAMVASHVGMVLAPKLRRRKSDSAQPLEAGHTHHS